MKVFRLDITAEQSAALVRELEQLIARAPGHRGIAAPIAAGLDGQTAYLAVEYVVGDSLEAPVRAAGPMPLLDAARIVEGIASAIDACADRGVHHGLLHPRDVIMSGDGPRVTGFGLAEALTRIGFRLPVRRPYAAPEGASDVYSLAAIAYELISGRRMTPAGWDELSAEDGPQLREAFASALSPDPQPRPARAGDFAAKLLAAGGSGGTRPPGPPPVEPPPVISRPDPEFATTGIDRFADAGVASDLHLDFVAPAEPELELAPPLGTAPDTPLPASWRAQPPKVFQAEESESVGGRGPIMLVFVLIAVSLAGIGAYLLAGRRTPPVPGAQTAATKPPVAATTVDLPPTPSAVPPEPALPAPTPSRPASGVANAPTVREAAAHGRLLIRSTPSDATVVINGQSRGKTPLTVRDLPLGSYTIHLARNGFTVADRRVRLTARQPSESIEMSLKPAASVPQPQTASGAGGISFESRPPGARVFINDRLVGSTPLAMPAPPAGPVTVRIEMDGYRPWITTVRVKPGEQTRVAASLDRK